MLRIIHLNQKLRLHVLNYPQTLSLRAEAITQLIPKISVCVKFVHAIGKKGPSRTVFTTESDSVVFYYSVVNLLRIA